MKSFHENMVGLVANDMICKQLERTWPQPENPGHTHVKVRSDMCNTEISLAQSSKILQ